MDESTRLQRLAKAIIGSGAKVNDPYGIWAYDTEFGDEHLTQLKGWADLEFLIADETRITDAGLASICSFRRIIDLAIGGTRVTSSGLASCELPNSIQNLGVGGIELSDSAIESIMKCTKLETVMANDCRLSRDSLMRLAALPNVSIIQAISSVATRESSAEISSQFPLVLLNLSDGLWKGGVCKRVRATTK